MPLCHCHIILQSMPVHFVPPHSAYPPNPSTFLAFSLLFSLSPHIHSLLSTLQFHFPLSNGCKTKTLFRTFEISGILILNAFILFPKLYTHLRNVTHTHTWYLCFMVEFSLEFFWNMHLVFFSYDIFRHGSWKFLSTVKVAERK